jgi:hypothetical protein
MRFQPGVEHCRHFWMRLKPPRHRKCISVVLFHSHGQRLNSAQHEEAVLGTGAGSHRVPKKADSLGQVLVADDGSADVPH